MLFISSLQFEFEFGLRKKNELQSRARKTCYDFFYRCSDAAPLGTRRNMFTRFRLLHRKNDRLKVKKTLALPESARKTRASTLKPPSYRVCTETCPPPNRQKNRVTAARENRSAQVNRKTSETDASRAKVAGKRRQTRTKTSQAPRPPSQHPSQGPRGRPPARIAPSSDLI